MQRLAAMSHAHFLGSKALGLECYVIYNVFAWQEGANLVFQGDS